MIVRFWNYIFQIWITVQWGRQSQAAEGKAIKAQTQSLLTLYAQSTTLHTGFRPKTSYRKTARECTWRHFAKTVFSQPPHRWAKTKLETGLNTVGASGSLVVYWDQWENRQMGPGNSCKESRQTITCQLRWRTEASGWAASAACSHHPTARVGHSSGIFTIRTSYVGRRQHVTRTYVEEGRISTGWRTSILATGQASTAGTIITLMWVFMANHVEETTDKRTMWRPRKFTSVEKMSCPCWLKMYRDKMEEGHGGPLRTTGIARRPPSGGVQSVCNATC